MIKIFYYMNTVIVPMYIAVRYVVSKFILLQNALLVIMSLFNKTSS